MLRRCNGLDPNLLRPVEEDESEGYRPCDCGKVFDDVKYMVIFPHLAV